MAKYAPHIERSLATAKKRAEKHRAYPTDPPAKQALYAKALADIADLKRRGEYIRNYRAMVGRGHRHVGAPTSEHSA